MKQALELIAERAADSPALEQWLASLPADIASPEAIASPARVEVTGTLTTQVIPGIPMRTESRWTGPLDGTSQFTLISLEDTQIPDVQLSRFRGDLVLSTPRGDLIGQDDGVWDLATGSYVDIYRVTSGTGDYAGTTAVIVMSGTLDPATGQGLSAYRGVITKR